jgi:hypothetical protein
LGLRPGDGVARISPLVTDLGWARVSRLDIIAEVDWESADDFWQSDEDTQQRVLDCLSKTGVKAVIAHVPGSYIPRHWQPVANTRYWLYRPGDVASPRDPDCRLSAERTATKQLVTSEQHN